MNQNIALGNKAPDFLLPTHLGLPVHLAEEYAQANVVLIFYPKDQTPGCIKQLCTASHDEAQYLQAGIRVFGINGDSATAHQRFIRKHHLAMPLLVDAQLSTAAEYGAVWKLGPWKVIKRTVVGIAQGGKIVLYRRGSPATANILAAFA